jgi:hypothetical protein
MKTKQLLCDILKNGPRDVTSLMKLSYLIDLAAVRKLGAQISEFEYIRYNYGPFAQKIYANLNELQSDGKIESFSQYNSFGENVLYKLSDDEVACPDIAEPEQSLIDEMLSDLSGLGAKMLTQIAYSTEPMVALGATLGGNEHIGEKLVLR